MKNRTRIFLGLTFLFFAFNCVGLKAQYVEEFSDGKMVLKLNDKEKEIPVLLAISEEEKAQGLMFKDDLGKYDGMFFIFDKEEEIFMWMKNTKMPLDMIFFDKDGKVVSIHKGAEPYSLSIIPSKFKSKYVLEVLSGNAEKIGFDLNSQIILIKNENKVLQFKKE